MARRHGASPAMQVVYFIATGGKIKVGYTRDLETRVSHIQTTSPEQVSLIGALPGGPYLERTIHAELVSFISHREWFHDTPLCRAVILRLLADQGVVGEAALSLTKKRPSRDDVDASEASFVALATEQCDRLTNIFKGRGLTTEQAMIEAADLVGIEVGFLWSLRYRPPKTITAGQARLIEVALAKARPVLAARLAGQPDETKEQSYE
jgi:hypothetical protein